jgi:hypothetical protein
MYLGKSNPKHKCILGGYPLEDVGLSTKDLGVFISANLSSSVHCSNIATKASKVSALILRTFVSKNNDLKILAFKTYVRPILEYASPIWNPHLISDINLIENVQRRFTRRLLGSCFSYEERLKILSLDRLELRRIHTDAIVTFKIIKQQLLPIDDFFSFVPVSSTRFSQRSNVSVQKFKLDCRKFAFCNRGARIWNSFPSETKESKSVNAYIGCLSKLDFTPFIRGRM